MMTREAFEARRDELESAAEGAAELYGRDSPLHCAAVEEAAAFADSAEYEGAAEPALEAGA